MSAGATSTEPIFVAVEADGEAARATVRLIAWAGEAAGEGAARPPDLSAFDAALEGARAFSRDPLFEQAWLDRLYGARGLTAPALSDWMLALAPFGVSRDLAQIVREASAGEPEPEDAPGRARTLLAVYRLARARSQTK